MVVALFLLTVVVFVAVNYFLTKEDRLMEKSEKQKKSPIFLSPDKALIPLVNGAKRLYHLSHSWVQKSDEEYVYVGYDNFVPYLFSSKVKIKDLPLIGAEVPQGSKLWDVESNGRSLAQLAPVSGKVVDINPACNMDIALPSDQIEKSWILKMSTSDMEHDTRNLMPPEQAFRMNTALQDDIYQTMQSGAYLNDGGQIDPSFIESLSDREWADLVEKYFPYQNIKTEEEA